jgi:hypothetical protein
MSCANCSHSSTNCSHFTFEGSHSGRYEQFCLLGYNAVSSVGSQLTFRRNISTLSSGSNSKPSKKPWRSGQLAESNPEHQFSPGHIALYLRRCNFNVIVFDALSWWQAPHLGPSLTRGRSVVYSRYWSSPAQSSGRSPAGIMTIFCCLRF